MDHDPQGLLGEPAGWRDALARPTLEDEHDRPRSNERLRLIQRPLAEQMKAGAVAIGVGIAGGVAVATATSRIAILLILAVAAIVIVGALAYGGVLKRFLNRAGDEEGGLSSLMLALLCLAVITSSWNGLRAGPGLAVCDVFFVLSAGVLLCALAMGKSMGFVGPRWLLIPAYALLVDVIFSSLLNGGEAGSLTQGLRLVAAMSLTPLLIGTIAGNLRSIKLIVDCWLISATVNASVASFDYLSGGHLGESLTGVQSGVRLAGLTTQPNHLGFVCVFALPFFVSRILATRRRRERLAYFTGMALCLLALLVSGSRGGLVVGVFVLASAPFFQASVRTRVIKLLLLMIAFGAIALVLLPSHQTFVSVERLFGSTTAASGVERSDNVRQELRNEAIENFDSSPVYGSGFGAIREAQNIYLQLLSAGGIFALVAWLAFAVGGLTSAFKLSRTKTLTPELRSVVGASAATFAAWMLLGAVENQLYDRYLFVPCGILVAALVHQALQRAPERRRANSPELVTAAYD